MTPPDPTDIGRRIVWSRPHGSGQAVHVEGVLVAILNEHHADVRLDGATGSVALPLRELRWAGEIETEAYRDE